MTYIILEMQTTNGTTSVLPAITKTDRQEAESTFHSILASAAVSQVDDHACVMLTGDGRLVRSEHYTHLEETE